MREEDVDKFTLDQLAAVAVEYGLIESIEDAPEGKRIVFRGRPIALSEESAHPVLQAVVHAWLVGSHAFP